jgi:hypothetical protein
MWVVMSPIRDTPEGFTTAVSSRPVAQSDSTFCSMTCIDGFNEDNDLQVDL